MTSRPRLSSGTAALATRKIRDDLIDLSHMLPSPSPQAVLRAWNEADDGLRHLAEALETQASTSLPRGSERPARDRRTP